MAKQWFSPASDSFLTTIAMLGQPRTKRSSAYVDQTRLPYGDDVYVDQSRLPPYTDRGSAYVDESPLPFAGMQGPSLEQLQGPQRIESTSNASTRMPAQMPGQQMAAAAPPAQAQAAPPPTDIQSVSALEPPASAKPPPGQASQQLGLQTPEPYEPSTGLMLLELLGGMGQSMLQQRAMGQAQKQTQRSQGMANLINTLSPGAGARGTQAQPEMGTGGMLLSALGEIPSVIRQKRQLESAGQQQQFKNELDRASVLMRGRGSSTDRRLSLFNRGVTAKEEGMSLEDLRAAYPDLSDSDWGNLGAGHARGTYIETLEEYRDVMAEIRGEGHKERKAENTAEWAKDLGNSMGAGDPWADPSDADIMGIVRDRFGHRTDDAGTLQDAANQYRVGLDTRKRNARKEIAAKVDEITKASQAAEVDPQQAFLRYETFMAGRDFYINEDQAKKFTDAILSGERSSDVSETNRGKFAQWLSVRSSIARVLPRLSEPGMEKHLGRLNDFANQVRRSGYPESLDPELVTAFTSLGFASENLLRGFTGAAAPDSEYRRYADQFIGTLAMGENLGVQLRALDTEMVDAMNNIIRSGKPILEEQVPLGQQQQAPTSAEWDALIEAAEGGDATAKQRLQQMIDTYGVPR